MLRYTKEQTLVASRISIIIGHPVQAMSAIAVKKPDSKKTKNDGDK
jgi:hypothetical protein